MAATSVAVSRANDDAQRSHLTATAIGCCRQKKNGAPSHRAMGLRCCASQRNAYSLQVTDTTFPFPACPGFGP